MASSSTIMGPLVLVIDRCPEAPALGECKWYPGAAKWATSQECAIPWRVAGRYRRSGAGGVQPGDLGGVELHVDRADRRLVLLQRAWADQRDDRRLRLVHQPGEHQLVGADVQLR